MLNKAACFTDIHWGRKNNSEVHNQDCTRYVEWFCEQVKKDPDIDHIVFMGDWFEQRSAINGLTLDYAYKGACKIKNLNLPVYFIVGNHDLYYRTTREVCSTEFFDSLGFNIINKPKVYEELGSNGALMCPYLFGDEYSNLAKYFKIPVWFGHFEFKGFILTGETKKMDHGPDPEDFDKPTQIFSGHFHKRQSSKNITYIGNVFPADFSDANDTARGMMVYDYDKNETVFSDWADCPSYIRTKLSDLIKSADDILRKDATVSCIVDIDLNYEQSIKVREQLTKKYQLREITLLENPERMALLEDTEIDEEELQNLDTTEALVINMLEKIEADSIDKNKLIEIYKDLKCQHL